MIEQYHKIEYSLPQKNEGAILIMSEKAKAKQDKKGLWYIQFRHQGERHYITQYLGQITFRNNKDLAVRSAGVINSEIDKGIFRPERWKRRAKKLYNLEGYSRNWLDNTESSRSAATNHDYENSFKNHINPILGHEFIEDINLDKLTCLMDSINRQPKGKKNVMGALHRMVKYAYDCGHIPVIPPFPEFKGKNKIVKGEVIWLEPKDQYAILENIAIGHRPIFTFGTITGCRPSEARAFRKQDIKKNHILFAVTFGRNEELKEVKGKKVMPFPLTEALKELFTTMSTSLGMWQFINPATNRPYGRNITRIFNRARGKAGLSKKLQLKHFFRQSFAMNCLNSGMEKGMVSHLLRHQDPRMIDHYAEYQTAPLKSALDKIQTLSEFATDQTLGKKDTGK